MKILLKNVLMISAYNAEPVKGNVIVENGKIAGINTCDCMEEDQFDEIEDLSGLLVIPGAMNTHTHVAMTLFRGFYDGLEMKRWLDSILRAETRLYDEAVYYASLVGTAEMVRHGCTAFVDMYFFEDAVARAVRDIGIRAYLTRGIVDVDGGLDKRIRENIDIFEQWHGYDGRIWVGFGPHAPYTCSMRCLEKVARIREELNTFVTIHLYETADERCKYRMEDLEKTGILENAILVHCVHPPENFTEVVGKHRILVSLNPASNMKLGNGIPPFMEYLEKGIPLSVGTDGAASNNSLNVWKELYLCALIAGDRVNPSELFAMLWEMPGKFFGKLGRLQEGYEADLVVINPEVPECVPLGSLRNNLVYSGIPGEVVYVMVKGEWIYREGHFTKIDMKGVLEEFEKHVERLRMH